MIKSQALSRPFMLRRRDFQTKIRAFIKRGLDIVIAVAGLIILSPVLLLTAFVVAADGGPVVFKQPRIGRFGQRFNCLKFRSMNVNADEVLNIYLHENPEARAEWQRYQKLKKDPRVTRFGAFLRRASLDELPQLLNVLRGEMSLVGPRPFIPGQEVYYGKDLAAYESVRPGITGPWQVSGRSRRTFDERVIMEAWYAKNWTLWMDMVILMKTFPALWHRGAAV